MKTIIAGSRTFTNTEFAFTVLNALDFTVTEVVSGTASGADKVGEAWAKSRGIPIRRFPAEWDIYGRRAGFVRNSQMANYAGNSGVLIVFWDGESKGSKMMIEIAKDKGMRIIAWRVGTT